jgi:hypothetical protein
VADGGVSAVTSRYMEFITNNTLSAPKSAESADSKARKILPDQAPINRFGSDVGAIESVETFSEGARSGVFECGAKIKVVLSAKIPHSARGDTAVSLGVKNKAGLDLFVLSTYDKKIRLAAGAKITVSFEFMNFLASGEYAFVASLENRADSPISYYDFLEGAAYFKVTDRENRFGLFVASCEIEVKNA